MSSQTTERSEGSARYLSAQPIHQQWESDYLNQYIEPLYEAVFERLVSCLGAQPASTILDAGCGYGLHAMRLARRGLRVTALDFSSIALRAAQERIAREGMAERISLRQGNLVELPFPDASFDFVNCWGVLMHVPELERALEELARVLKPGGRLAVCENNMRSLHVRFWEPILRGLKHGLGRKLPERRKTERGIEEWQDQSAGGLMVRKIDLSWLQRFYAERGLNMIERFPSQFTELYANVSLPLLKRAVYSCNMAWFEHVGQADYAMGNVVVFEKQASAAEA